MTARVEWHSDALAQRIRNRAVLGLDRTGVQGKAEVQGHTPRRTGVLQDSEHYVVVDESGQRIAGDETDGNGNAVPVYPGNGQVRVIVGTNEGAEVGYWYGLFVEIGTRGRPGRGMLAQSLAMMIAVLKSELQKGQP